VDSHGDYDAGWGKLLVRTPELAGSLTSRDIWERVGGMGSDENFPEKFKSENFLENFPFFYKDS
jgi:hypothetical protein